MPHHSVFSKEESILLERASLKLKWFLPGSGQEEARPVLVFLHDSLGCIKLWRDFPEQLAKATGCSALVYDRQGYGESSPFQSIKRDRNYLEQEAEVLEQLLEQLQITKAILFGHSDGGSIALIAAAKYRNRIAGIITEGAHVFVEDVTLQGIREAVAAYQTTLLPEKLQKYHGPKTEAVFHAWADTWLSEDYRHWNIEQFLKSILCPVLVIQGEADEYGTLAQVEAISEQVQGPATTLLVPAVGHTPHREALAEVLLRTAQFIAPILSE